MRHLWPKSSDTHIKVVYLRIPSGYQAKMIEARSVLRDHLTHYGSDFKGLYEFSRLKFVLMEGGNKNNSGCDLTKVKKSWKMGCGPGSPFGLEDKAPWISWLFNFWGFTDSKSTQTRGLDTIQATSLFPWIGDYFFLLSKIKSWNQEKSCEITGLKQLEARTRMI